MATTEINTYVHTLSLRDALPIFQGQFHHVTDGGTATRATAATGTTENVAEDVAEDVAHVGVPARSTRATAHAVLERGVAVLVVHAPAVDRKSTRLNSSH